jgi:hypothetical protein
LLRERIERRPDKRRKVAVEPLGCHLPIDCCAPWLCRYRNRLCRTFGRGVRLASRPFCGRPFGGTAGRSLCTVGQSKRNCRFARRPRLVGKLPRDGGSASTDESQQKRMPAMFALHRAALVLRWRVQFGGTIRTTDCRHGLTLRLVRRQHVRQGGRKARGVTASTIARRLRRPSVETHNVGPETIDHPGHSSEKTKVDQPTSADTPQTARDS